MDSGPKTREYRTLQGNLSRIVDSLSATVDPSKLALKLHEANLVTRSTVDSANVIHGMTPAQRIYPVLSALLSQVELDASKYHGFVTILEHFNPVLADFLHHCFTEKPTRDIVKATDSASTGTLDIPCLGRPFQLGMLYDCHRDCLVPSITLWDPTMLQQATDQRQETRTHSELISDDSLASKTFHLGMQANLKLSFLTGLVNTAGSAKYLDDHKSSNKLQARVTFKYSCTTRFEELILKNLGTVRHPTLREKATHIVTGVLYGAEAFFVFDQEVSPSENYQTVHDNMKKVIKSLPDTVTVQDMAKVQCTVYCDFQLPENLMSFQDAAKLLKELPKLIESSNSTVPKRVQLFPLNKLDNSPAKILHKISPELVAKTENFVETFHKLQMQCNDIMKMEVSSNFPTILKQLSRFQQILSEYKSGMTKELASLLPRVRGGETQEADMIQIFKANDVSSQRMLSWLNKKEREVHIVAVYLDGLKELPFVSSPKELDAIVHNFEYDFVVCFSFLVAGEDDAYLQCLSEYLRVPQVKQGFDKVLPKQWHEDRTIVHNMRSQARQFKDFVKANRIQKDTKFIVSSCANFDSSDNEGAITILFKDGLPEIFLPPTQPGKATAIEVTSDSILLEWDTPKCGAESVRSYTISYHMENDPVKQWKVKRTQDSTNTSMITQLAPESKYYFKVQAQCEVGVSPESEMSKPIVTDRLPLPGRPGKPTTSKVSHNSVVLHWPGPKSGIDSIEYYTVLYCRADNPSLQWQSEKTKDAQKEVTVSGLEPKVVYCFKVCAEGATGVSPESEITEIETKIAPPHIPGRPGKPIASKVTHNSVHLNWSVLESETGSINSFLVSYRRMDNTSAEWQTTKTRDSQNEVTVSGLLAEAVYCFKVRAESKAGNSPDSEMCDPIATSPPPVPGRPGKPTVSKVTHNSIHLNWPGPEFGIEGVMFYSVIYRRMDNTAAEWQTTMTQDSQKEVTVSGLAAKAIYCFKVRAESEAGNSPDSEMCDPIATSEPPVPGRPGKPTVSKVTHNSIHLNWPDPEFGVEGVKFYSVIYCRMDDPSAEWQTTKMQESQKELTVSGLAAKVVYCFKVRAECEAGNSPYSELSDPIATSPPPLPGSPGKPMASKVTHNSVDLNWSGPESFTQGIKNYLVSYRQADDPSSYWQTLKTQDAQEFVKVSGLAAKTVYYFKVGTECETGRGPESEINQITTRPLPTPSCPGKPIASNVSHDTIKVNWSHPQHGAENVKYYTILYHKTNRSTEPWKEKQTDGVVASLTVSNLDAKSRYYFKVRAESEAGASNWSEVSLAIETHSRPPPSQPSKPYFSNVSHDTVVLRWSKPNFGGQDIKYYTVSYYVVDDCNFPDKWKTKKTAGPQESITVSGLTPSALYCFNVRAESDAGCSSSSESSDPLQLRAPPAPSQPGKPTASDNDIIHNSILLKWAKPKQGGEYVNRYSISYRREYDPVDQWQTKLSDGARTALTVSGLDPKTQYSFKVRAVSDNGISMDSEVSIFHTKAKVRLAEGMLSSAILIEHGPPKIYKLKLQEVTVDEANQLKKCAIGKPDSISSQEKVLMVLGATGAGKTTLINGMTNYLLGVEWRDDFRFKLIVEEVDNKTGSDPSQAVSQTKWITAYTFHHQKGSPLPYTFTIIDTPGFGDTGGLESDHRITEQIKQLFSMQPPNHIDHLNAIGIVTQTALARLTPTQKYIFDAILAMFGKDIAGNIFMMATFSDGGVPPVLATIKAANIPFCDVFKFNNSALCARPNDSFGKMFWEMGLKSFEDFFAHLDTVETRSLRLTREVLDMCEHLETVIQGLLPQIQAVMSTMDEIEQEEKVLQRLQVEATDLENQGFKYTVKVVNQRKVDLYPGKYATNCLHCNFTCHYPCTISRADDLWRCLAMNWPEAGENSVCQVCPGNCPWQRHANTPYRIETYEEVEERTFDDLLKKYETVKSDKNAVKIVVDRIRQKVKDLQAKVVEMICEAQQILARLDEIALKPNPLNELDYIDLLIESEKQQWKPGFKKRLEYLQEARKHAKVIQQINQGKGGDAPQWLKDAAEKAKANVNKHSHGFQNPQYTRVQPTSPRPPLPPPGKQTPSRGRQWGWPFKM